MKYDDANHDTDVARTPTDEDFAKTLASVAREDATATSELWQLVKHRLGILARRAVYRTYRSFDEDDVIMIVFASLYQWLVLGNHVVIQSLEDLERRLATMTKRVVINLHRYESRHCRGGFAKFCHEANLDEIVDPSSHLTERADFKEELDRLMRSLRTRNLRELLSARLEGRTYQELAQQFGCSTRTIERRMAQIRSTYLSDVVPISRSGHVSQPHDVVQA